MVRTFLFVAGAAALDFVNTEPVIGGEPVDLLADDDDLQRWLRESRLGPAKGSLREAKALRADLGRLFLRLVDGLPLRPSDLAPINAVLKSARSRLELQLRDGKPSLHTLSGQATPAFLIARAAAEFLATADLSRIRRCEGAACVLIFYDTTRSRTRRWCSMAWCGNRAKAAAHYERTKKSP